MNVCPTQILSKSIIFKDNEYLWVSRLQQFALLTEKKNSTISRIFCEFGLILAFQEVLGKILSSFWWGSQPNQRESDEGEVVLHLW